MEADEERAEGEADLQVEGAMTRGEATSTAATESGYIAGGTGAIIGGVFSRLAAESGDSLGLWTFLVVFTALGLPIFGIWFARTLWKRRAAVGWTQCQIGDGEFVWRRGGGFGTRNVRRYPLAQVEGLQKFPVEDDAIQEALPVDRHWELTLMTREEMQSVSVGIEEEEADRLIEELHRKLDRATV